MSISIKIVDIPQKRLRDIYDKTKIRDSGGFTHDLLEPTLCSNCGNYRLDFGGKFFECPQTAFCGKKWDRKLQLKMRS